MKKIFLLVVATVILASLILGSTVSARSYVDDTEWQFPHGEYNGNAPHYWL